MRYLVFLSLFALALYAATAEDIYKIYKTKGINAVEDFLKKEFESKEVKEVPVKEAKKEKEFVKDREVIKEPTVKLGQRLLAKPKTPTEKESVSRDYWLRHLKNMDVSYGYYEDVESLIVCEKERKHCEIFHIEEDGLKLVRGHDDVIMGKSGDKVKRGDLKTPVGVYEITKRFKPTNQFYGPLAFALSYPNLFDVLRNKSGDGIWIHGTPIDGKDRDDLSKGCVVMENNAILNLDTEINAQSAVVIIGESKVPKMTREQIATILSEVYKWQRAWKVNDINAYLNFYSNDFKKSDGSGKVQFSNMKKQIFSRKESKMILFENMSVVPYPTIDDRKLFKISFLQTYKSPSFASKGDKELYIELVGDKMQVLAEK
jgi:murein L,D-transpeptidase YafK